jgi:hypothetical protein
MKIGIITFHKAVNYGAVLQAYALSQFLKSKGHDVFFINYHRTTENARGFLSFNNLSVGLKMFLKNPGTLFSYFISKIKKTNQTTYLGKCTSKSDKINVHFNRFRNEYFKLSELSYKSPGELKKNPPVCDAYIAGSDQIWGHGNTTFSDAYFLNFGPKEVRRIAYAPSFGAPSIPKSLNKDLCGKITKIDFVSVREKSGMDIIKKASNIEAVHVLDPTLLLSDYSKITSKIKLPPYLFVFKLKQSDELETNFSSLTSNIANQLSLDVNTIDPMGGLENEDEQIYGIEEFLGLIKNASFMLTNSFHGTVFAIINNIDFICCPRTSSSEGQNDRMTGLLDDLGLKNRFFDFSNGKCYTHLINDKIDWKEVNTRLDTLRKISIDYLTKALK